MHYYFIACCTRLPMWQDRCYRASRELCSNYLLVIELGACAGGRNADEQTCETRNVAY